MRVKVLLSAGVLAASLLAASAASASIVTVTFAGNLNLPYFGSQTGAISGTATYDTAADNGQEYQSDVVTGFSVTSPIFASLLGQSTIDKTTYAGSFGDVHYVPDGANAGYDQYELILHIAHFPFPQLNFDLIFPQGTLPGGYGLPTSLAPIGQASFKGSRLDDFYGDLTLGSITEFSLASTGSAAPEPAAWALAIVGFAGTGAALRRRRAPAVA